MKKIFSVYVIALIVFLFAACGQKDGGTDAVPQSDGSTNTYDLGQLLDYFGELPPNEREIYCPEDNPEHLTFASVNQKFPAKSIRQDGDICRYCVYSVTEGGCYYVFWTSDPSESGEPGLINDDAVVYFTAYIAAPKEADAFDSIREGFSTAEDVACIDPALELSFLPSSEVCSFSLLSDGRILEIRYSHASDTISSRMDLIVESTAFLSREEARTVSYLASIDPDALP